MTPAQKEIVLGLLRGKLETESSMPPTFAARRAEEFDACRAAIERLEHYDQVVADRERTSRKYDEACGIERAAIRRAQKAEAERDARPAITKEMAAAHVARGLGKAHDVGALQQFYAATFEHAKGYAARFSNVWCSQCGRDFGPGDSGYSHCAEHAAKESTP